MSAVGAVPGAYCFAVTVTPGENRVTRIFTSGPEAEAVCSRRQQNGEVLADVIRTFVRRNVKDQGNLLYKYCFSSVK